MSFLESRNRGLPYGGIPYQELLNKLEETDMNETSDDIQNNYNNYIRSEIIDRTLEVPFLESDKTKRDGSLSKSILNLRYNGSRGDYERPVHPEMFVGFMDQDNRGLDNNPRMDEYNKQIKTRMPNLEVRMGNNCTEIDFESPWTNQSLGQCRRDIQTALAYNTKIFTDERDGRALNRNFIVEYDHNKKPLIYKDLLPYTINNTTENVNGKTSTAYTTSAVPFVSTDTDFTPSYKNINSMLMPGNKACQRYINNDQVSYEELINMSRNSYSLSQNSKLNTSNDDQVYQDHYDNYSSKCYKPGTKYTANNTDASIKKNELDYIDFKQSKTTLVNPITNAKLLDNDSTFNESNYHDNRRNDYMKYSNSANLIKNELHPHDITNIESELQKSVNLYGNNNNITLVNSSFYIPEFSFKHMEIAKHAQFPDNQTIITKTNYDIPYDQDESQVRASKYRFSDDVGNVMRYSTATVPDTTYMSQLRSIGNITQEHKVKNANSEDVWASSDENNLGKSQSQTYTGGIEPTYIEIPESHDIETNTSSKFMGTKSIRGDNITSDYLNSMSENLVYEDNF